MLQLFKGQPLLSEIYFLKSAWEMGQMGNLRGPSRSYGWPPGGAHWLFKENDLNVDVNQLLNKRIDISLWYIMIIFKKKTQP